MEKSSYEYIIIGAGSTGLPAADFAAQLDAKVLLVEADRIGGDCTWTGCVPSKALLYCASVIREFTIGQDQGWVSGEFDVDFSAIQTYVRNVSNKIAATETPEILKKVGIDVIFGPAKFVTRHTIELNDEIYHGKKFLICTGATPNIPPIEGIQNVPYHTYRTIYDIDQLPNHLIIVGGGPTSCEMGQVFRTFGSQVTIIEEMVHILPKDDPDAGKLLTDVFQKEGIEVLLGNRVEKLVFSDKNDEITAVTKNHTVRGDALLMAVGRKPNVSNLNLDTIGVSLNEHGGIRVNNQLKTSQNNIYAAGDCLGGFQFTHLGGYQGVMATRNALLPFSTKGTPKYIPWTTFTHPAVAHVGITRIEDYHNPNDVKTCYWPLEKVDRAITENKTNGFIKIFHKKNGTILGVTIVAPQAGEMLHEWIFAIEQGKKMGDISNFIHVYPTYSIGNMRAAYADLMNHLLSGLTGKVIIKTSQLLR
jgi:pyruvate/2-oxoglutarate dehydrogenase complex dihydrolipoamide dehydrogenase (E3) component